MDVPAIKMPATSASVTSSGAKSGNDYDNMFK
jgi:hypothetical protein